MNERTEEQIESWDTRQITDGYEGLRELADRGFSGVVTARGAWLFMLNGRGVGIYGGPLDTFDNFDSTAHLAPDPSLPLLFAMQEEGGEVEAKYYTNDTPLSEANRTLTDGNFTGFVELSENVLSGDYYVVYYGGRSMSCAFVGESERLLTGEEAFERANDEVGIYEVVKVDIGVIDIPDPEDTEASPGPGDARSGEPRTGGQDQPTANQPPAGGQDRQSAANQPPAGGQDQPTANQPPAGGQDRQSAANQPPAGGQDQPPDRQPAGEGGTVAGGTETPADDAATGGPGERAGESAGARNAGAAGSAANPDPRGAGDGGTDSTIADLDEAAAVGSATDEAGGSGETDRRQTRTIPSLNPERTSGAGPTGAGRADVADTGGVDTGGSGAGAEPGTGRTTGAQPSRQGQANGDEPADRVAELESALEQRETEMSEVRQQLTSLQDERDEFQRERDELRTEVDRLQGEIEQLQSQLQQARAAAGDDDAVAGRQIDPEEALAGTDFFVRYGTKGGGTLEKAHAGDVHREEVNSNLRLEHHTRFEESEVEVDGQPFDTFLEESMESGFVAWFVENLLYEIRDTNYEGRLRDVYDAIPKIDRAELKGAVSVEYEEDGEQYQDDVTFDVVLRDRMGNPLVVANLNDSRDPTTVEMMEGLVEDATMVKESHETLAGAMFVTSSFFQPGALERADEAATSGLLSRDKRASFVTRASTGGYHLCLVENRGGDFHVNVPDM